MNQTFVIKFISQKNWFCWQPYYSNKIMKKNLRNCLGRLHKKPHHGIKFTKLIHWKIPSRWKFINTGTILMGIIPYLLKWHRCSQTNKSKVISSHIPQSPTSTASLCRAFSKHTSPLKPSWIKPSPIILGNSFQYFCHCNNI